MATKSRGRYHRKQYDWSLEAHIVVSKLLRRRYVLDYDQRLLRYLS